MMSDQESPRPQKYASFYTSGFLLRADTGLQRGWSKAYVSKPSGYSFFPQELMPIPISWAKTACNMVSTVAHDSGGHFAALEKPHELLADVEEYIKKAF